MTEAICTTKERIRQAHGSYEPPALDQKTKREYGRIRAWYETLVLKGSLPEELALAARDVDMYWHGTNDPTGVVGSYGQQRWNGTPVCQVNMQTMLGPEWRETARRKLMEAKTAVDNTRHWDGLCHAIETNASLIEVAAFLGVGRDTASRILKAALTSIAVQWGYAQHYHPPSR